MAMRPAWTVENGKVIMKLFDFKWNSGFAISQKRKNINNLHNAITMKENGKVLEVSTKSEIPLGIELSAFNLKLNGIHLENVFQSSKKYDNGGPYFDLLTVEPRQSKRDERHKISGNLVSFCYEAEEWNLFPKTAFYDYIYVKAAVESISQNKLAKLFDYKWFTDIEFNPQKSTNCQARSVTILQYLLLNDMFDTIKDKDSWIEFHKTILF